MTTNNAFKLPDSQRLTGTSRPTLSRMITGALWYTYEGVQYFSDGKLKKGVIIDFTGRTWITSKGIFPTNMQVTFSSGESMKFTRRPCGELILVEYRGVNVDRLSVLVLPARLGITTEEIKNPVYWENLLEKTQKKLMTST